MSVALLTAALTAFDAVAYPASLAGTLWVAWLILRTGSRLGSPHVRFLGLATALLTLAWMAAASIAYSLWLSPAAHRAITHCVLGAYP